mmetsp:Transcript_30297/g.96861  ORF Transcript_30297/g.96861 Transcript_30297/m.96861 type:complete len:123 (-) Transcript_30297:77-445(-)
MPYSRGDRIPTPPGERMKQMGGRKSDSVAMTPVEKHFAKAQELEPQALEKMRSGESHEALELFNQVKRELTEAIYASGPGSANYPMLKEACAATNENIKAINSFLPFEFLLEPKVSGRRPGR